MDITAKWQDKKGEWREFFMEDVLHMPRNHSLKMFQQGTPIIIKEGNTYIVNKVDVYEMYKKQHKQVMMLSECKPDERPLAEVGFIGLSPEV